MSIDKHELAKAIEIELQRSVGYWQDELSTDRQNAMAYYNGKIEESEGADATRGADDGLSRFVSEDVAAMVDADLAQMVPSICGDVVVNFTPTGEQDEDAAQLETDKINALVLGSEEGLIEIMQATHDALLLRNGILKTYVEEKKERVRERYENVEVGALAPLTTPNAANQQVEVRQDDPDQASGGVTVIRTTTRRTLRFRAVPPERMVFSIDHQSMSVAGIPFVAEQCIYSRSELVDMGISKAMAYRLPAWGGDLQGAAWGRKPAPQKPEMAGSAAIQMVQVWEVYIQHDIDADGIAELVRAIYAPDGGAASDASERVLKADTWPMIPYAVGTAIMVPHQLTGRSLYDNLRQVQIAKTGVTRQYLDNMAYHNNNELSVIDGQANADDLLARRPGAPIRIKRDGALTPIPVADIGGSSIALLHYLDGVRAERGGAALDLQTASAQIAGDTAHGVERQYGAREKLAEMMLRTLCLTLVRQAFKIAHASLRTWSPGPMQMKFRGNWITQDPAQWPARDQVNLVLGLSDSERTAQAAAMGQNIAYQIQAVQQGQNGVMVDAAHIHAAIIEWGRLARIVNPESYWIDPMSQAAQQESQANAQAAAQASQEQARVAAMLLEIQTNVQKWGKAVEYRYKYFDSLLKAEIEEAKLIGALTADLERTELVGMGQMMQVGAAAQEGVGNGREEGAAGAGEAAVAGAGAESAAQGLLS